MKILYAGWGVCGINGLQHILSRGDIKPKDIVALSTEESSANMISDYYKSLGVKCVSEEEILRSEGVEFDIHMDYVAPTESLQTQIDNLLDFSQYEELP